MKVNSNKVSDILFHYTNILQSEYKENESKQLIRDLLEHFTKIPNKQTSLFLDERISESELLKIHFAVKELLLHKPLQYIFKKTSFLDYTINVNENVLIPRPETEELVNLISENTVKNPSILDIGTGSGCIAIALQKITQGNVFAIDISEKAIDVAKKNAVENDSKIEFSIIDILNQNEQNKITQKFDIIVSNPPYIRDSEQKLMQKNVLNHEPHLALFVTDSDPLIFYTAIAKFAKQKLKNNGELWFEINENLSNEMHDMLSKHFKNTTIIKDFRNKNRFCKSTNPIL